MALEDLQHNFLTGQIEDLVRWARRASVWPASFGLACCAIEMMAAGAADFDLSRFGMEVFRNSPRQADLMIVAGRVSQKMAPVLRQVYDQMMEPKWVISMGVCASSGGMFNNYAIVQGVDQIVPVDDFWRIPEQVLSYRDDYNIFLRHYTEGVSETVMFFIPKQ